MSGLVQNYKRERFDAREKENGNFRLQFAAGNARMSVPYPRFFEIRIVFSVVQDP